MQSLPVIEQDVKEVKEPQSAVEYVNEIGEMSLIFNQDMFLDEILNLEDFTYYHRNEY